MKTFPLRRLAAFFAAMMILFATALPAQAGALGDAKAAGQLGERPDGYVGLVTSAPAGIVSLMKSVNSARRAHYQSVAAKNGTTLDAVQAIMGQKLIGQLSAGQYYMDGGGNWVRR
ncbi:Conserved exported protein of unknown function [Magnetospira sp. QH-2]|nr:Conserved exported protein of unknown function [Magnetospira sp. QH-2]